MSAPEIKPDPALHRPGSSYPDMSGRLAESCMECSWFEDGYYVPWPCPYVAPPQVDVVAS